jgi:hypothetical protein
MFPRSFLGSRADLLDFFGRELSDQLNVRFGCRLSERVQDKLRMYLLLGRGFRTLQSLLQFLLHFLKPLPGSFFLLTKNGDPGS